MQVSAEFDWDSSIQGLIFSSGGFISFLFPIFADPLCRLMGSKLVMTSFTLLAGVLTVLNPLAAGMSPYFLIVLRVFIGAAGVGLSIYQRYCAKEKVFCNFFTIFLVKFLGNICIEK